MLLRHGQTAWNAEGRAQGHTDVSLDDVGRAQAEAAAAVLATLRPVRLWSSDLARAHETAERVSAATGLAVELSPAFREYSVGLRSGLTLAELEERFPDEHAALRAGGAVAGAESDEEVLKRFVPAMEEAMAALGPGECGILVSHGAALRTSLVHVLGLPDSARDAFATLGNGHWVVLEHSVSAFHGTPARWRLRAYNDSAPGQQQAPDFASGDAVG